MVATPSGVTSTPLVKACGTQLEKLIPALLPKYQLYDCFWASAVLQQSVIKKTKTTAFSKL
jgi:hypothetical protein